MDDPRTRTPSPTLTEPGGKALVRTALATPLVVGGWVGLVFGAGTIVNWIALTLIVRSPAPGTGWLQRGLELSGDGIVVVLLGLVVPAAYLFAGWHLGVRRGIRHLYRTKRALLRTALAWTWSRLPSRKRRAAGPDSESDSGPQSDLDPQSDPDPQDSGNASRAQPVGERTSGATDPRIPLAVRMVVLWATRRVRLPAAVRDAAGGLQSDTPLTVAGITGGLLDGFVEERLLTGASLPLRVVVATNLALLALAIFLI